MLNIKIDFGKNSSGDDMEMQIGLSKKGTIVIEFFNCDDVAYLSSNEVEDISRKLIEAALVSKSIRVDLK